LSGRYDAFDDVFVSVTYHCYPYHIKNMAITRRKEIVK